MLNKKIYLMMSVMIMNGYGMESTHGSSEHLQSGSDQESTESQSSDNEKGDQFILELKDNVKDITAQTEDFKKLSQAIQKIREKHGAAYFVAYAGFHSDNEKMRFKNPRWVFFDKDVKRTGIKGDLNNLNICKIQFKKNNILFDYITDDWDQFSPESVNIYKDLLAQKGKMSISMIKSPEQLRLLESLQEEFDIYLSDDTKTPAFYGEGTHNATTNRIENIKKYLEKHIPKELQNFESDKSTINEKELHDKYLKLISDAWDIPKPKEGFESTDAAIAEVSRIIEEYQKKPKEIAELDFDSPLYEEDTQKIQKDIEKLTDVRIVFVKK